MSTAYVALGFEDVALAALLLLVHGALSLWLCLGMVRSVLVAATRMVIQLALVALVLEALFRAVSPWLTLAVAGVMIGFAGYEATARQSRRLTGGWTYGIGASALLFAATTVTVLALATAVRPAPWYHPQYAIPLLGMVLGNAMNGVALGLDSLLTRAARERPAVEALLALGHDRRTAFRPLVREALRAGLIPIVNSMAATGLVALPGMMTGQILAGVPPVEAVKYQMLVMFLIAGGTALGALAAVLAAARRLSDERHRLRVDRLGAG